MSERKIRLTLSSTKVNNIGALIDVDFDSENLDVDLDVAAEYGVSTLIKEYTVDVAAGTYNLDISYKNDLANDSDNDGFMELDRNLFIEKIEVARNGVDYENLLIDPTNCNLEDSNYYYTVIRNPNYDPNLPRSNENHPCILNPNFDSSLPLTDESHNLDYQDPGSNPGFLYEMVFQPIKIYTSSTATFQIEFS